MAGVKYRRVVLKISGEGLCGKNKVGIDGEELYRIAREIKSVVDLGIELAVVVRVPEVVKAVHVPVRSGRHGNEGVVPAVVVGVCARRRHVRHPVAIHVVAYGADRFRVPILPVLFVAAAGAWAAWREGAYPSLSPWRRAAGAALLVLFAVLVLTGSPPTGSAAVP